MSTQEAVRSEAKAVPAAGFAWVAWGWLLAVAALAAVVYFGGGEPKLLVLAALCAAPALIWFWLLPRLGQAWADLTLIAVWSGAAFGLSWALGPETVLAVAYAAPIAIAAALGRPWTVEAGAVAALLFALAALTQDWAPHWAGGFWAPAMAVAFLGLAAALLAFAPRAAPPAEERRIAELSHELRTPLTHILGFAELIERQIFGPIGEQYVEYAGLIRKSGSQLLKLVNDMLDLSRLNSGGYELALEVFDARAIVEEAVQMATLGAEAKSIALATDVPESALVVRADEDALRRILTNTLGNAVKFTPEHGRIAVAARAEDGALVLETIDNGPGIGAAERERLGRPYVRGAAADGVEGAGLGLSLVRALAAAHGGRLSFHDSPGGGALVRVTLPVLAGA